MDRAGILRTVADGLTQEGPELVAAWIFGSTARDERKPDSDVDLSGLAATDPSG